MTKQHSVKEAREAGRLRTSEQRPKGRQEGSRAVSAGRKQAHALRPEAVWRNAAAAPVSKRASGRWGTEAGRPHRTLLVTIRGSSWWERGPR